ncbi:16S rRNA (guanine(527)-N(7))-methyltransferase RsmG [Glaciecola petra]|uniref:Ribosomal RNA small subunit methyltransferase G n=1 Tax=Glaciecola petra TaxID=3075602 RepID=A0ABU2ZR12_9ALTE|nr:16S rRNA (guanine(527)-N(7))-methyltransferase RsmG [Aestuariibacter sp. P117]MDT0594845.1 16S rRNA (guanine(527)-N(7))-methyltransferase RsmG [Aestuariibacter sp. P117]
MPFLVSHEQQHKLIDFVLLLHKWNKAYNLSAVREPEQMLVKHIFDSIVVSPYLKGELFADVGTGPGLPGIPLAIMNPDKTFHLIDSLGKRIRFIKQAAHELNIENILPIQNRVEKVLVNQPYDGVLSRAFASLNDMLQWCSHLIDGKGQFLALKGQLHEEELNQIPEQFKLVQSIPLLIPSLNGERHLVVVAKN